MCFHKLGAMCATTASTVFCVVVCCFDMFLVDRFGHSCASVRLKNNCLFTHVFRCG